ncbi:MAG: acyltransferase [Novosphingobium sp.]
MHLSAEGQNIGPIERFASHKNSFGFLRLLFAALVIVSHTPELVDGNRSRELLTRLFGTISFGEFAVDCFFVVSGYLIAGSFITHPDFLTFLRKRVARIYPAFLVSSFLAIVVAAPLSGTRWSTIVAAAVSNVGRALLLQSPRVPEVFAGSHHAVLNGAVWTISFEFGCYLLIAVLGVLGAFRSPKLVAALACACFLLQDGVQTVAFHAQYSALHLPDQLYFVLVDGFRLSGVFLVGTSFYLWRNSISFSAMGAAISLLSLTACLRILPLAEPGLALFGGYIIFAFAGWGKSGLISRINNRNDVSYGLYLYAWPIEKLLIFFAPGLPTIALGLATLIIAAAFGAASWFVIEKPVLQWAAAK